MLILLYFFVAGLAVFTAKGLFNSTWREHAQGQIDSIKNERLFWRLMSMNEPALSIEDIYFGLFSNGASLASALGSAHEKKSDQDNVIKLILNKDTDPFGNISVLNEAMAGREQVIESILEKNPFTVTASEIKKALEYKLLPYDFYDRIVSACFNLKKEPISGSTVWTARKDLKENPLFDSVNQYRLAEVRIGKGVADLLGGKTDETLELKKNILEWEQLHMLRSCIVKYSSTDVGLNKIKKALWRILEIVV